MGLHASHDEGSTTGRASATAGQLSMLLAGAGVRGNRDRERVAAPADASNGTPRATSRGPDYAEMMARYLGPGIVAAFADSDVTEIYLNAHDERVRLDTRSRGKVAAETTLSAERLEMFLNAVASSHGVALGPEEPSLQAELPLAVFGGARLQGFVPPVVPRAAVVMRKRPETLVELDAYARDGVLPAAWADRLREALDERATIVVAGGTGSGKTTLLGALLLELSRRSPRERLVLLEDTVELRCPLDDHLALRTTPTQNLAALVKATLRTSPTRIVIGEVRDQAALDFLDAAVTGHPGGLCTVHATTAAGALARLDRLAQRANVPPQAALVADAVDLVVVLHGGNTGRRAVELARVAGLAPDGRFLLHQCTETGTWESVEQ